MTTVAEIIAAIETLTDPEREGLRKFFVDHEDDAWDRQMKDDARTGKLDAWLAQVDAAIDRGETTEMR
jgi:hypothetical protein